MAGSSGYLYTVRMNAVAVTAAKTLIQIKAGAAAIDLVELRIHQVTKTDNEMLEVQILRKSAAATVTSFTPIKTNPNDPTALAVGGTAATGTNASAEGTDADILDEDIWNVILGSWKQLDIPEGRFREQQGGIIALKLNTAPAASMTIGAIAKFLEYR